MFKSTAETAGIAFVLAVSCAPVKAHEKVRALVYVAAYLPGSGESLVALSHADKDSGMGRSFRVSDDKTQGSIDPADRGDLFCNGCSAERKAQVAAGIVDEPLATPVTLVAPVELARSIEAPVR